MTIAFTHVIADYKADLIARILRSVVGAKSAPYYDNAPKNSQDQFQNVTISDGINIVLLVTFLACTLCAFSARAASFECGKAQSKVEHLICDHPENQWGQTLRSPLKFEIWNSSSASGEVRYSVERVRKQPVLCARVAWPGG